MGNHLKGLDVHEPYLEQTGSPILGGFLQTTPDRT